MRSRCCSIRNTIWRNESWTSSSLPETSARLLHPDRATDGGIRSLPADPRSRHVVHRLVGFLQEIALHEVHAGGEQDGHAGRVFHPFRDRVLAGFICLRAKLADLLLALVVLRE